MHKARAARTARAPCMGYVYDTVSAMRSCWDPGRYQRFFDSSQSLRYTPQLPEINNHEGHPAPSAHW